MLMPRQIGWIRFWTCYVLTLAFSVTSCIAVDAQPTAPNILWFVVWLVALWNVTATGTNMYVEEAVRADMGHFDPENLIWGPKEI